MELTRHGVRNLDRIGKRKWKAIALREEATELEQRATGRLLLAEEWQKRANALRSEAAKLQVEAVDKRAEAEKLCPR